MKAYPVTCYYANSNSFILNKWINMVSEKKKKKTKHGAVCRGSRREKVLIN